MPCVEPGKKVSLFASIRFNQINTHFSKTTQKNMKNCIGLLVAVLLCTASYAQSGITKIVEKDEVYYITTDIGLPIIGLYQYEGKKEPIVSLKEGGQGLFQLHGMSATNMVWGIECDATGKAKVQEAPWGGIYRLWYKITEKHKGKTWESGEVGKWDIVQFSVHSNEHKMYILGERIRSY
jgi:hypothetical protein